MNAPYQRAGGSGAEWRTSVVLVAFLAIAAFFLITEHTAHLYGVLPFVLLLLCPLLHLLMHGGHVGHREHGTDHAHGVGPVGRRHGSQPAGIGDDFRR
jgi:hypothetical protein